MKHRTWIQEMAVVTACLGMVLPPMAMAAPPLPRTTPDIALQQGGVLTGQVVDAQGIPQAKAPISIRQAGVEVSRVTADKEGHFKTSGLHGGVFHLVTTDGQAMYRVWTEGTAPPAAQKDALLVTGNVVRGQWFGGGSWLTNPWVLSAIVAAAIAIPIAVHDNDSGS
ncbi:MAG: hypothetical protein JW829_18970 [Pirellulales bacterium]|nr:hypothetical protein [Pirellulales bacterium]